MVKKTGVPINNLILIFTALLLSPLHADAASGRGSGIVNKHRRVESKIVHSWDNGNSYAFNAESNTERFRDRPGRILESRFNLRERGKGRLSKKPGNRYYKSRKYRKTGKKITDHKRSDRIRKNRQRKNRVRVRRPLKRYRVKKGDTLYKISRKFRIPVSVISSINRLSNRNRITRGMLLKIPGKDKHVKRTKIRPVSNKKIKRKPAAPKFRWPLKNIVRYRRDGINGVRSIGLIITGKPGSKVVSSAPGIVGKIGNMRGFGRYIIIRHQNRYITVYSNLDKINVSEGQRIRRGRTIGKIDKSGRKLHFQIDYSGKPLNPIKYLPRRS